jgi:hypothetical protein
MRQTLLVSGRSRTLCNALPSEQVDGIQLTPAEDSMTFQALAHFRLKHADCNPKHGLSSPNS